MVEFCSLASSSSGNCFYYQNNGDSILIDAGIRVPKLLDGLSSIGKSILRIKGIFITHEHTDHVAGLNRLLSMHQIPVYLTAGTLERIRGLDRFRHLLNVIRPGRPVLVGDILVMPFAKSHDCPEPVSYSITSRNSTVSFITDVGYPCENVISAVNASDALFIEANHDPDLLESGPYPHMLKRRILGPKGHLSNYQAALLLLEHASPRLKRIFLSHLSETNNTPEIARKTVYSILKERTDVEASISVCPKDRSTELVYLDESA